VLVGLGVLRWANVDGVLEKIDLFNATPDQLLLAQETDQQKGIALRLHSHHVFHDLAFLAVFPKVDSGFTHFAPPNKKRHTVPSGRLVAIFMMH
jgi:hypothetical protein